MIFQYSSQLIFSVYIIYAIATFIQLYIGVFLFRKSRSNPLINLSYLSYSFLALAFSFFCSIFRTLTTGTIFEIVFLFIKEILQSISLIMLLYFSGVVFNRKTTKSFNGLKNILILSCIFVISYSIVRSYDSSVYLFRIYQITNSSNIFLPGMYLGINSLREYTKLKLKLIETWVLKRYLYGGIASLFFAFQIFPNMAFTQEGISQTSVSVLEIGAIVLIAFISVPYSVLSYVAWVMPSFIKNRFTQNQSLPELADISEAQFQSLKNENKNEYE